MHYAIIVPKQKIQEIKNILIKSDLYDQFRGICRIKENELQKNNVEKRIIHTLRKKSVKFQKTNIEIQKIFPELKCDVADLDILIVEDKLERKNKHYELETFIHDFIKKISTRYKLDEDKCIIRTPTRWTIYGNMALLPKNAFSSSQWTFLSTLHSLDRLAFYEGIAKYIGVTHIAMNATIPPNDPMRIPVSFVPLYGDFGPRISKNPTKKDFEEAFWVTTKQNGIYQVWSPMYTMFSRGNKKARIFRFPDVKNAIIADLYAGIGYFAFSYLKAKAKKVFCWEINPWSIEGLCRGAQLNKFTYKKSNDLNNNYDDQLIVFENTNKLANKQLAEKTKNIRHINLGLLPSSEDSWPIATKMLDSEIGGWIHVHAAVCDKEIYSWTNKSKEKFTELFKHQWEVKIEHIEKVKRFSPKSLHIVVDLSCIPKTKKN
ncbi:unnamed protein product [Pneumocystis jirovecii]|uniref:tRNA wybutosine-synthesizing protein 2 n=1 Tax=Pneumocystis jirovecii TaxID=42068 RepID=L0PF95_PNEJI|nr:unnamed protein product [Pneumocystis jirovecii]CCJ31071.1 unnamed protein product [Pneumocystis jirovecii]